jgi:hypothetical protein
VTGPNQRPTPRCRRAGPRTGDDDAEAIGTTSGSKAGVADVQALDALSTEIAGVSRQSP